MLYPHIPFQKHSCSVLGLQSCVYFISQKLSYRKEVENHFSRITLESLALYFHSQNSNWDPKPLTLKLAK